MIDRVDTPAEGLHEAIPETKSLDSLKFLGWFITSPKRAINGLFSAKLARWHVASSIALLGGECIAFASCVQLITRGHVSTGCALVGSCLALLLLAGTSLMMDHRNWRATLAWEGILLLPAAIIAATASIVLVGFAFGPAVTSFIHPALSASIGIGCTVWIVAWKAWGRETRHVYTGSLLDIILPVIKAIIDLGTFMLAAFILITVHFTL
jgi:hypothetical protein